MITNGTVKAPYIGMMDRGVHRALCPRCAKRRLSSTAGSHGAQGPEFCTPDPGLDIAETSLH